MSREDCYKINTNNFAKLKMNNQNEDRVTLHCRINQNGNCAFFPTISECASFNGSEKLLDCSYNMHNNQSDCSTIYNSKCVLIKDKYYKVYGIEDALFMSCKKEIPSCKIYKRDTSYCDLFTSNNPPECKKYINDISTTCSKYSIPSCKLYDTLSSCMNDIVPTGTIDCLASDIGDDNSWCNISNQKFLSPETLSTISDEDCIKILEKNLTKEDEEEMDEQLKNLKKASEISLMILEGIRDELPGMISVMLGE